MSESEGFRPDPSAEMDLTPVGTPQERIDGLARALAKATGIIAERDRRIADYENAISWNTSCTSCAAVLDSSIRDHDRAERAEGMLAAIRRGISPATVFAAEDAAREMAQERAQPAAGGLAGAAGCGGGFLDAVLRESWCVWRLVAPHLPLPLPLQSYK